jgi:hypothetical protein
VIPFGYTRWDHRGDGDVLDGLEVVLVMDCMQICYGNGRNI